MKALDEEALAAIGKACGEHAGELALGASQTIAQYLLPNMIASFIKSNPRVHVTAKSGNSDEMLEALVGGEVHLALIEGPEQRRDVHIEPFMEDHMVLVVPAGHEWADHTIGIEELKSAPLLMREFGSGSRRVVEQALVNAGLKTKDLNVRMEIDSTEGLLSAVEAGLGVTFVSRWTVRNQLALQSLRTARVKGLKLSRRFSLVYRSGPEPHRTGGSLPLAAAKQCGYAGSSISAQALEHKIRWPIMIPAEIVRPLTRA